MLIGFLKNNLVSETVGAFRFGDLNCDKWIGMHTHFFNWAFPIQSQLNPVEYSALNRPGFAGGCLV